MKFRLIVCIALFLSNCEDKQTPKQTDASTSKDSITQPIVNPKPKSEENQEFPVLSDDNAMEFFLEYDKVHKENKVRRTGLSDNIEITGRAGTGNGKR